MNAIMRDLIFVLLAVAGALALPGGKAQGADNALPLSVKSDGVMARRYGGSLIGLEDSLKAAGYSQTAGFSVKNGDLEHPWQVATNMMGVEWCLRDAKQPRVAKNCVYTIQRVLDRDSKGYPKVVAEDALEFIPISGFDFRDEDEECSEKNHPNRSVVAIGRWKLRKPPQIGGYVYSIKQAWIVDPDARKFVEISPKEVVCEINEDRD